MQIRLKHDKFILKTRSANLEPWQQAKLAEWRETFPTIGIVYDLKEEFYEIYDSKTKREAKTRFEVFVKNIPPEQWEHWSDLLRCWGNWETEILEFFETPITNAYTECQNMLTRAIDSVGRGYSFEALRVKLLRAPKKQCVVTSYRTIRRKRAQELSMGRYMELASGFDDGYETIRVPVQKQVTYGIDLAKLLDWREEDASGQKRLPGLS
jgi:transposase